MALLPLWPWPSGPGPHPGLPGFRCPGRGPGSGSVPSATGPGSNFKLKNRQPAARRRPASLSSGSDFNLNVKLWMQSHST